LDSLFEDENQADRLQSSAAGLQVKIQSNLPSVLKRLCNRGDQLNDTREFVYDEIFGTIEALLLLGQADTVLRYLLPETDARQITTNLEVLQALTMKQFSHHDDFNDSFFVS